MKKKSVSSKIVVEAEGTPEEICVPLLVIGEVHEETPPHVTTEREGPNPLGELIDDSTDRNEPQELRGQDRRRERSHRLRRRQRRRYYDEEEELTESSFRSNREQDSRRVRKKKRRYESDEEFVPEFFDDVSDDDDTQVLDSQDEDDSRRIRKKKRRDESDEEFVPDCFDDVSDDDDTKGEYARTFHPSRKPEENRFYWSPEELGYLREGVSKYGRKWVKILKTYNFNNRTRDALQCKWKHSSKKKKLVSGDDDGDVARNRDSKQPDCCILGCEKSVKSGFRKRYLKCGYTFKKDYLKNEWAKICNSHKSSDRSRDLKMKNQRFCCVRRCMNKISRYEKSSLKTQHYYLKVYLEKRWTKICKECHTSDKDTEIPISNPKKQKYCCILGCQNLAKNYCDKRILKCKYKFKKDYLKEGWTKICNAHRNSDLRKDLGFDNQRFCCIRGCKNRVSRYDKSSLKMQYYSRNSYLKQDWTKICESHYRKRKKEPNKRKRRKSQKFRDEPDTKRLRRGEKGSKRASRKKKKRKKKRKSDTMIVTTEEMIALKKMYKRGYFRFVVTESGDFKAYPEDERAKRGKWKIHRDSRGSFVEKIGKKPYKLQLEVSEAIM